MDPDDVPRTHPERVVFPDDQITKGEVVDYYAAVAERIVPHLAGRPLTLERFRKDIAAGGFYQQGRPDHFPDYVPRIDLIRADGEQGHHTGADSPAAVVYLANQGVFTFHAWPATLPNLERPDRLVLDLDPSSDDFAAVRTAALSLRAVLTDEFGLHSVPLLTGSRGVHVIVPLDRSQTWEEIWPITKRIGAAHVATAPDELTRARYKSQRRGRLFVDTGRARRGHTAIVPWTVRARATAPVATPITWAELEGDETLHAQSFTLRTALGRPADPWDGALGRGQRLPE